MKLDENLARKQKLEKTKIIKLLCRNLFLGILIFFWYSIMILSHDYVIRKKVVLF